MKQWMGSAMWNAVSWAALIGVASAQAESDSPAPDRLRARVELGASATQFGVKVVLEGGFPHSSAWIQIAGGASREGWTQCVRLDANGAWSRRWIEPGWREDVRLRLAALTGSGAVASTTVLVPYHGPETSNAPIQTGTFLIREFMKDPSFVTDAKGEWVEIVNRTSQPVDLRGFKLADNAANSHTIGASASSPILAMPNVPFVLGNNADPLQNGGITVHYKYSSFSLGNGADSIVLVDSDGRLCDQVDYDDGIFWPDEPGRSASLHPTIANAHIADDGGLWCDGSTLIGGGNTDLGTPGSVNPPCP